MALKSASPAAAQLLDEVGLHALPSGWGIIRIEELLSEDRGISVGVMYPGDHYPAGIPLIRAGDLAGSRIDPHPDFRITPEKHQEYRRTQLEGGELLISLVGDLGRCAIVPREMAGWNAARAIAVLRLIDSDDAAFVRACLMSAPLQYLMQAWATTTVQATLNLKEIRQIPLPWPPKGQREAIAQILGTLDDKIELNRLMNETLEATARALFKSWFVDFDPVRAKAEGRDPDLPKYLADLFPNSFEDSELGETPKGWAIGTLGDYANRVVERVEDPVDWQKAPLVDLSRMPQKSIALRDWGLGAEMTTSVTRFRAKDTLFGAIRPYFHKVGFAPMDGVTNVSVFVVRAKLKTDWPYIALLSSMTDTVDYATRVAKGTKMPVVSWSDFQNCVVVSPPEKLRATFGNIAAPALDRIICNIHEMSALAAIREALLPMLISGTLRVKDAERFVGTAA